MTKKALVTGSCGFTGSHMLERLDEKDWEVVATDLEGSQREKYYDEGEGNVPSPVYYGDIIEKTGAEFIPADLTKPDTLEDIFEEHSFDVVFNIASLFDYFAEWDVLEAINVKGVRNLAEVAAENNVGHFINWSTLGVLGHAGFDEPLEEEARYHAHNRYCESKVQQEKELHELRKNKDLPLTIIRPAPIYGPRHRYGIYHILLLIRKFGFAPVARIYPRDKRVMFPSVHIDDLVDAAIFLHMNKEMSVSETYHVLSDPLPAEDVIEFVADSLGVKKRYWPVHFLGYRLYAKINQVLASWMERRARGQDMRPKIDASMTFYLGNNMWFSNQKIKDLGYSFKYRDQRKGLWSYITWCKSRGWI